MASATRSAHGRGRRLGWATGSLPDPPNNPQVVLPCLHVSNQDLLAGDIAVALDSLLAQPFPDPPDITGADVAARRILEELAVW